MPEPTSGAYEVFACAPLPLPVGEDICYIHGKPDCLRVHERMVDAFGREWCDTCPAGTPWPCVSGVRLIEQRSNNHAHVSHTDTCACEWEKAELRTYALLSGPDSQAQRDLDAFRCPHVAPAASAP